MSSEASARPYLPATLTRLAESATGLLLVMSAAPPARAGLLRHVPRGEQVREIPSRPMPPTMGRAAGLQRWADVAVADIHTMAELIVLLRLDRLPESCLAATDELIDAVEAVLRVRGLSAKSAHMSVVWRCLDQVEEELTLAVSEAAGMAADYDGRAMLGA